VQSPELATETGAERPAGGDVEEAHCLKERSEVSKSEVSKSEVGKSEVSKSEVSGQWTAVT
jgi:hypothetical protein